MENQNGFPGELPAIPSGMEGGRIDLVPGEGFWERIEQIAVKGEMTRGLDMAMHGRPSPRIWLFLHEPGRGELSAAVAMSFARELAFRDQAALVLDCDDKDQALTRWAGRVEEEGWIDLARYGTSVLTSGMPMPFVGRRGYLLGVGSFAPTDVTGEEVDTLLTRLRRQADDLLLVAPSDSTGLLWAPAAAIRILCWDRQTVPAENAGDLANKFEQSGCPLTAVVTFQEAGVATEKLVDDVLAEVETPAEPVQPAAPIEVEPEEAPADTPEIEPEAEADIEPEIESDVDEEVAVSSTEDSGWRDLPLEQEAGPEPDVGEEAEMDSEPEEVSSGWNVEEADEPIAVPAPVRETSRVFWIGALVAVAVIVASSVYYFKYMRVPAEGHFQQIEIAADTESPGFGNEDQLGDGNGSGGMNTPTAAIDSAVVPAGITGDSLAAGPDAGQAERGQGEGEIPAVVSPQQEVTDSEPVEETPVEVAVTPPAGFDMEPYREPVGTRGWALHVYSLPDSSGTVEQVRELDRRGFTSAVRNIDLGEKGRWHRIYLGSFASRSEAKAAMPALLKKLRVDWAKPEIFKTSAPE